MAASWSVDFHPACEAWAESLEQPDGEALLAAIRVLQDVGPRLGRPLVEVNILIADDRFDAHQTDLCQADECEANGKPSGPKLER